MTLSEKCFDDAAQEAAARSCFIFGCGRRTRQIAARCLDSSVSPPAPQTVQPSKTLVFSIAAHFIVPGDCFRHRHSFGSPSLRFLFA